MTELAALMGDPARAAEVPVAAILDLLRIASIERERIGFVERALLARLTGEPVEALCPAPSPVRSRSRGSWLRVAQVVEEYGVKPATVYDWIYKKRVTTKKVGTSKRAPVLLHRADLERRMSFRRALRHALDGP